MTESRLALQPAYSAVVPVFNSAGVVGDTIAACVRYFEERELDYELILVDDGSTDGSWEILKAFAATNSRIIAARLLRNYGQHSAVHCGLGLSRGQSIIVLDDDLQNWPSEIDQLIARAADGYDVVFGKYVRKKHSLARRIGSWLTNYVNTAVFRKPHHLVLTNFKLIQREVVERILHHRTHFPYVNGLAVLYARNPTHVAVEHHERRVGRSNYDLSKTLELLTRILFSYSAVPLRLLTICGAIVAALSFCMAAYVFTKALFVGTSVPGWASITVMLAFFNGTILVVLGVIGEYLLRILQQTSAAEPYHIIEVSRSR